MKTEFFVKWKYGDEPDHPCYWKSFRVAGFDYLQDAIRAVEGSQEQRLDYGQEPWMYKVVNNNGAVVYSE